MQKDLRERHWKEIAQKYQIKDNALQKALSTYEKVKECNFSAAETGAGQHLMIS